MLMLRKHLPCFLLVLALLAQGCLLAVTPRKIVVGGDYNYPPYEFINSNNQPDGYNVELTRAICKQLGWTPEFKLAKWALVRQWLDDGTIDLVQGMAFSVERAQIMRFSDAHAQTWRAIFVRKGSPVKDVYDLKDATVAIQQGDIAKDFLKRMSFDGIIIEVPTQEDALQLLDSGEYDAAIVNFRNGSYITHQVGLKHIKALPYRIQQKEYCYAAKDGALINEINNALLILSQSGQLDLIQKKWLSKYDEEVYSQYGIPNYWIYSVIPLLIVLLLTVGWLSANRQRYKKLKHQYHQERDLRTGIEAELARENNVFVRGPVILYKLKASPMVPLMISENVDQWGYTVDEFLALGEDCIDIVFSEDRPRFLEQMANLDKVDYLIRRYRILTKNGEIRWVLDYTVSVDSNVHGKLLYGYLMDITSHKNMEGQLLITKEKAEAASMAKTHFLASMSHEIRTPLNGIMGFIQVLMQMESTPEQREYYEIMYSSGKSLMKIINDILDFSKIESGKLDLIKSDFNPRSLIGDILKPFIFHNHKPDLVISSQISERIPNVLHGDQLRLKQILINLLQNAIKFTEKGFVEIRADIYTQSPTDVRLLFCVVDTGIGIDPKKQQDIFDNFSQADPLITSKYGGTGLGLSIVKRLVELMSGFIWVESEQGKGSSFFFIIPFDCSTGESSKKQEHPIPVEASLPSLMGMKVLLVEDEPINQVVTRHQLEGWQIEVDVAANGQEAMDKFHDKRFDAILMDVQMPVMDGITTTQSIRLAEASLHIHTPIIAFTAAALVGDRERFLESGMDDYIAKPIEMPALHHLLQKYFPGSRR